MPLVLLGDTAVLPLGVDERLEGERKILSEESGSSFFDNSSPLTVNLEYRLENRTNDHATIIILDRVPISRNDEINVEIREASTPYEKNEQGIVRWKRTVAADTQKKTAAKIPNYRSRKMEIPAR